MIVCGCILEKRSWPPFPFSFKKGFFKNDLGGWIAIRALAGDFWLNAPGIEP
jgi:hypothetical protein